MEKRMKIEGDPYSKFVQAVRRDAEKIRPSTLEIGTITSAPPDIKLRIDNDPIEYDAADIYVAEHLAVHERIADISGHVVASSMTANGQGPHTHDITGITLQNAKVVFRDELKSGDRVLVECNEATMKFTIMDRVVSYK